MLPLNTKCDDDGCAAPRRSLSALAFASLPFTLTFAIVSFVVLHKLFPLLSGQVKATDHPYLPSSAPANLRRQHAEHGSKKLGRRISALAFSTTIALAAVLAELILCEISNSLNPAARSIALKVTIPTLLFLLVILIPFLELQSVIKGMGWSFDLAGRDQVPRMPWLLQTAGFVVWLMGFWWLGKGVPGTYIHETAERDGKGLNEACLERVGVIGISLMALLSGFASISSPWQSFGAKPRPVTEADINRKQAGVDATNDMLVAKRSRLRALQRKMNGKPDEGFLEKVVGSIRGNADAQETKALQFEINGLESMAMSLNASLSILKSRHSAHRAASTPLGKCLTVPTHIFSIYCIYRIIATTIATLRRYHSPTATFSNTDPINRILGLLAKHWDPTLDQVAWSRQISFALSGVILLASFNSVLQTFNLFAKFMPALFHQAQANIALLIAQISATYVISSALLLRSNLPKEVGSVISEALGSPLEPGFVDRWFEGWFLLASVLTALGIWAGRKLGDAEDWDDYAGDIELGQKRS
jgi:hypothetical protein